MFLPLAGTGKSEKVIIRVTCLTTDCLPVLVRNFEREQIADGVGPNGTNTYVEELPAARLDFGGSFFGFLIQTWLDEAKTAKSQ